MMMMMPPPMTPRKKLFQNKEYPRLPENPIQNTTRKLLERDDKNDVIPIPTTRMKCLQRGERFERGE
jgi:hypothetical protein